MFQIIVHGNILCSDIDFPVLNIYNIINFDEKSYYLVIIYPQINVPILELKFLPNFWPYPKSTPKVPQKYPKSTPKVPQKYPKSTPKVPQKYPKSTPKVPQKYL